MSLDEPFGTASDEEDAQPAVSPLPFPVVGIGASAGGLAALLALFEQMPAHPGMAFVVILHLSPRHDSAADRILQRVTAMPVLQVEGTVKIEADHVYVIPPSKQLHMVDGELRLSDLVRLYGGHLAIDHFFRSLAEAHRARALAVVLSGTGSDGSQGLRRIKECGGVALVQSPADAEHDMMPLNAMATGMADFVLPAAEMPQKLTELWQNAQCIELPDAPADLPIRPTHEPAAAEQAYAEILALLLERSGHDFRNYKRATVLRRLERRMQVCRQATLPHYLTYLRVQPEEARLLLQDMLISVTSFFRDREAFDALERALAAGLAERQPAPAQLRAWVAGCATGEEAYSVAILLLERAFALAPPPAIQVFASDVDERAITTARGGVYAEGIASDVAPARLRQFFHHQGEHYRIGKVVRERITFSAHNLLRDPPFSRLDLVCCRNLLIYLNREAQRQVLELFRYALLPHGLLFLGSSETADAAADLFEPVDKRYRIYRCAEGARPHQALAGSATAGLRGLALDLDAPVPGRDKLLADIHQQMMDQYAPPSVMVDDALTVVHLSAGMGRFVLASARAGQPLLEVVLPPLRLALEEALVHARRSGESVESRRVRVEWPHRPVLVNMLVRALQHPSSGPRWLLVVFIESEAAPPEGALPTGTADQALHDARADMMRSADESAHSTEELRAANEELQSLNEELRSATEELETSKEELQSVNEELITVNQELKAKVEETAKANDDLKNLIAANDIATVFVDADLRIKRYTPRAAAVFNIIASDVGRPLLDITHRLEYADLAADAHEAFASLRTIERELSSRDGRWYLLRLLPYRTAEDRIEGAVLNFIDITSRREAEERLRAGEDRMRLVAETTQDYAIITLDRDGRVTRWNTGAEQMFGWSEAEAVGQPLSLIFTPDDRRIGAPHDELRRAREQGRCQDERWHLRRDGQLVYCSGVTTALPGVGAAEGYAKIARDLTDTRRVQEQRETLLHSEQLLRSQLEAANRQKDEFLAVMSHELKNPLNLIALNADLLQRLPDTRGVPAVVRIARTVRASVDSQAKIINDLLDLSRMQTGKLSLSRALVPWNEVVDRIVEAVRPDAEAKGLALALDVSPGEYIVDADLVRLEQIVWNLVSNAIKFTPAGGRVNVRLQSDAHDARLEVADTGRGVDPAFKAQLFDMFSQAESGASRRDGGLGIGLALTKRLVDLHGGTLDVQSRGLDQGATFSVTLARGGLPDPAVSAPLRRHSLLGEWRLLVVDDEPDTLQTFAALLALEGGRPTLAHSGEEALRLAAEQPFDLLLSDLAMPGMDGYTLLRRMREAGHAMPAVAVSGMGRLADRKRALATGFVELVSKPVEMDALLGVIAGLRQRG